MINTLFNSVKLVNSNSLYVLVLGVLSSQALFIGMPEVYWLAYAVSLCIEVVVFRKIVSVTKGENYIGYVPSLKQNLVNYVLVTLILTGIVILFEFLVRKLPLSTYELITINIGMKATVTLLTAFVLPVVLIKHVNLQAIPVGIIYLFSNIKRSRIIVFLSVLLFLSEYFVIWLVRNELIDMSLFMYFSVVFYIVKMYLLFLIFTAATYLLLSRSDTVGEI